MGFLAPAIPWIAKGAGALVGMIGAKKAQKSAQQRSPEEQQALSGAQSSANVLGQQGQELIAAGSPYLQQAGNYYSTLLGGNRAAMRGAVAQPTAAITDIYRGAERGLERSHIRGAARDVAASELGRQRASQLAGLYTGVQPAAAQALAGLGGQFLGAGAGLAGSAGSLYSHLLGQGFQNRVYGREEGEKAGQSIGGLIFDVISGTWKKKPSEGPPPIYGPGY
jgi:hypothetical protein